MGRTLLRASFVLASVIATLWMPTSASALSPVDPYSCTHPDTNAYGCNVSLTSLAYYKGWGHVTPAHSCGGPVYFGEDGLSPALAWRWTSRGWQGTSIARSTRVYIYPYATGWSWVWTSSTGWLAVQDLNLVINPWCDPRML